MSNGKVNPAPFCANDGTCSCAKFHDDPEGCETRTERGLLAAPPGATHYTDTYGKFDFFRKVKVDHLNQVSEEWQAFTYWDWWDCGKWNREGAGFCDRRLKEIGK